jgi:hypothetical protein
MTRRRGMYASNYGSIVGVIPWSQGKCREFRRCSRSFRKGVSKTYVNLVVCETIPYASTHRSRDPIRACGELFDLFDWSREFGAKSIPEPEYPIASKCRARPVLDCRLARGPERPPARNVFRNRRRGNFFLENEIMLSCPFNDPERFDRTRRALRDHGEPKIWKKDLVWFFGLDSIASY